MYKRLMKEKHGQLWQALTILTRLIQNKKNWFIGNGGFSLRNVSKSLVIITLFGRVINKLDINEDIFWSIYAPLLFPFFKVPNLYNAIGFAFEQEPQQFYKLNNNELPFGCHAWEKYDSEFWKKWINTNG